MMQFTTDGDAGDCLFQCSIVQELASGPHALLVKRNTVTTLRTDEAVQKFIRILKPLIEIQPYIADFRAYQEGERIDWDGGGFRAMGLHYTGISLLECHAQHLASVHGGTGRGVRGTRQWLYVEPSMETRGMVVVNRTDRYNNPFFPWKQIVEHYRGRILFIGLKHEHVAFCRAFGNVSWRQTANMLDMARIISGSDLFIGNQSSANAINEGLKHPVIQETALHIPDCIFRRSNAQHVADGECVLPDISGSGVREIEPCAKESYTFKTHMTPPQGWQYGEVKSLAWVPFLAQAKTLPEFYRKSEAEVACLIMEANWKRQPEFFSDPSYRHLFNTFRRAHETASVA